MKALMIVATAAVLTATPLFAQDDGARSARAADVRIELQGLYDEIGQSQFQFADESDVELFHDVLYTPDWTFTDVTGHAEAWPHVRAQTITSPDAPRPDSQTQPIQQLSLTPDGATVVVNEITVRTIVDREGRYGREGASHMVTEATTFRDRWVRVDDEWKLKSREQMREPVVSIDKFGWGMRDVG